MPSAWDDAVASAMTRQGATQALLERGLGSQDLNREVVAQRTFGTTPLRPRAQSEVNYQDLGQKMPDPGHSIPTETDLHTPNFVDQGEAIPGASKGQSLRGRAIARSLHEGRSSIGKSAMSATPKAASPQMMAGDHPADIVTGTGEQAGAIKTMSAAPKDLGRVASRVLRGSYGDVSKGTVKGVKGAFMERAGSIGRGLGETLGSISTVGMAAKAAAAYGGMRQGQVVNPLTLETHTPKEGEPVLTMQGIKKAPKPPVES